MIATAPATPATPSAAPDAPLSEWLQVMTEEVARKREAEAAAAAEAQRRGSTPAAK